MRSMAASATGDTQTLNKTLKEYSNELGSGLSPERVRGIVANLLTETQRSAQKTRSLEDRLSRTSGEIAALQENLGFLVARFRERPQPRAVVRRAQRDTIEYPDMGLTLQDLSGHFLPGVLEARLGILARGAHSGVGPMTHRGEEFCFVMSGAISYRIGEETYDLGADDYLHFRSEIPHSWENAVADETRVLWVFSDGLSF